MVDAFVLMPFDDDFNNVYDGLIQPALEEAGFQVTRADLSINQQQILKDIVNGLSTADLVVVDVTGLNGNVMYELGLAHAMGRRTVMITRNIDELPFDLRSYRANEYSVDFVEAPKLRARLTEIARGVVDGTAEFSNPVQDFAPEFLGKREQVSMPPLKPATTADSPSDSADEDMGLLDYVIQLAESSEAINEITGAITEATAEIGEKMSNRTAQIERTNKNLGAKAAPVLRNLMRDVAVDFDTFSNVLEAQNPLLLDSLTRVAASANGMARMRSNTTPEERQKIEQEIASLLSAEATFDSAYESIKSFGRTIAELPPMEKSLTSSIRRSVSAVNETADSIKLGKSEFARARGLLEERLEKDD